MYDACRYEKSWYPDDLSPWCAVFSNEELKVMEYIFDLAYYYNSGPGLDINKSFGCPLLQDMIMQFKNLTEDNPHHIGKFYFGHSTTLFNLLSVLETHFNGNHITSENFSNMQNRLWRTSLIDPFGSNFAAVFLKCDNNPMYRIMFLHNEMDFVLFKGCTGSICNWDDFYNQYKEIINSDVCDTSFCDSDEIDYYWIDKFIAALDNSSVETIEPAEEEIPKERIIDLNEVIKTKTKFFNFDFKENECQLPLLNYICMVVIIVLTVLFFRKYVISFCSRRRRFGGVRLL